MGPQGSGKGTIGQMLARKLGVPFISGGDLLRNIPKTHPRFKEVDKLMSAGELAPFDLVAQLWLERLNKSDCADGYVMDGWSRDIGNLDYFDPDLDKVIVLNISMDISIRRITGRRLCDSDNKAYNIYTLPKEELEKCEGNLIQREDDTEEAVKRRLEIYYKQTVEVIDLYKKRGIVVEVDGEGLPDEVFKKVLESLDLNNDPN